MSKRGTFTLRSGINLKTRIGFVSNSSSTSFCCSLCGESFFGWDWDDDPVCPKCNTHIDEVESFLCFIIKRHNLSYKDELGAYRKEHNWVPDENYRERLNTEVEKNFKDLLSELGDNRG